MSSKPESVKLNSNLAFLYQDKRKSTQSIVSPNSQIYAELSKPELIKLVKSKDRLIEELKEGMKSTNDKDKEKLNMYRARLEEQIAHNQMTVKTFGNITQTVVEIIKKYQFLDQATRETVANAVVAIRETCAKPIKQVEKQDQQAADDSFDCIEQIADQTAKLLDYLSKLTDENVQKMVRLRSELSRLKAKDQGLGDTEEVRLLKLEIKELVTENKNLSKLLQRNESEKNRLIMSVNAAVNEKAIQQLHKLTIVELIEQIKKLTLRAKELEFDKEQIYKKSRQEKELNQKKYIDLLMEVKQLKTRKQKVVETQ